ncbi:hypothetical protein SGCOL_009157 [Colletotrichum sp. CLE4]
MDEFCVRLLSYFDRGMDGKPGRWPHSLPSPEYMAGAGFRFQSDQKDKGDIVTCDFCRMQAWAWERKDDPFAHHKESKGCEFIDSDIFHQHHDSFLRKKSEGNKAADSLSSPPPTPTKKSHKPRRKLVLSPIVTVYDSVSTEEADRKTVNDNKPVEIAVSIGQTKIVIQVIDDSERDTKRTRLE